MTKTKIKMIMNKTSMSETGGILSCNAWVMAARPSTMDGHHHPLITRFHQTSGPHYLHLGGLPLGAFSLVVMYAKPVLHPTQIKLRLC